MDLIKDLNSGYISPSWSTLSGYLLDKEVARINKNINSELENIENLTLSKLINIVKAPLSFVRHSGPDFFSIPCCRF